MKKDAFTTPYILVYGLAMTALFIVMLFGAFTLSRTPIFNRMYIESMIKLPIYNAQVYIEEHGLPKILPPQRMRAAAETGTTNSVPVLMYHGITKQPDGTDSNLTFDGFKDQMMALYEAGYTTVSLEDFTAFIRGEKELPKRSFLITFDDGRRDSFYYAGPLLNALNYTAVMYMIGTFTEESARPVGNYYLSKSETALLARSDTWEIGSHSYNGHRQISQDSEGNKKTYFLGGRMWVPEKNELESIDEFTERARSDLERSQVVLQEITGEEIKTFAFPFGNYGEVTNVTEGDAETKNAVLREASKYYDLLFYQSSPQQYFTQAYISKDENDRDRTLVRRITVTNDMSGKELVQLLESGSAKDLPFIALFSENEGWVEAWGMLQIENESLTLDAEGSGAGAATVLDGTRHWLNYRVDAEVTTENGSSVVLMLRHDSEGNTAACNYGKTFVHINQTLDGMERVIRGSDNLSLFLPEGETRVRVGAEVNGRRLRCYLNGVLMVETQFLDPILVHGGVGFKTWNPLTNAKIRIHNFKATPVTERP